MTKADYIEMEEITFQSRNLPTKIKGFSYHDDEGRYVVVINSRLDIRTNKSTADHELRHIKRGDHMNTLYYEYR